ncbi:N-6 DNA methylase [Vibrio harveyi]|nr:N-6 DNA methylase [Vibrio harveyi]
MAKPIAVPEGKLVDFVDGKFRADKPEERVRQNILKRLVNSLKYPKTRIDVERGIKLGSAKPRIDIALYKEGAEKSQENIEVVIECKKESVSPADKKEGIEQLKSYMAACLNCEWGLWTNGKHRQVWRKVTNDDGKLSFIEEIDIPSATGKTEEGRKRKDLHKAVGDVLLYAFKSSHNHIHAVDGFQKEKAFFELLKLIFSKIWDEKNIPHDLTFYVLPAELNDHDGQIACKKRIAAIFESVKNKFPSIFPASEEIDLNPRSLVRVVAELQNFSLLSTNIDIKGKAYEEIVGSNLKGDRGQFFTPRNMMHMAVDMVNPGFSERVLDPACGTGGFVVTAMLHAMGKLEKEFTNSIGLTKKAWRLEERRQLDDKISEMAGSYFFGFDITPELVKAAKMNMVMNNDGSSNVFQTDSLLPPYMWSREFRKQFVEAINKGKAGGDEIVKESDIVSHKDIDFFDVIVTNPPFGSKIVIKDSAVLEQYELGYIWSKSGKGKVDWNKTDKLQSGVPPEQLFVERCIQLLKPGGRMAIVLPDSILGAPGLGYIRQWLLKETKIIASIDLHQDAFQPHTGVQTSILIVQKKTALEKQEELERGYLSPYNVFMAIIDKVGHDKRGNTVFKRDEYGDELLSEVFDEILQDNGEVTLEVRQEKIVDDESIHVAPLFEKWKLEEGIDW